MLDGDHVRRRSIGSVLESSPCVRVGKRAIRGPQHRVVGSENDAVESPNKAMVADRPMLVNKSSVASMASSRFGDDRMTKAQRGLIERQSLEENCLSAEGENNVSCTLFFFRPFLFLDIGLPLVRPAPVFTRPDLVGRSRSSTVTTTSSGAETPPLSVCDVSSQSSGSQSSIDVSHLSAILANVHPVARDRTRARARGVGHRRRASQLAQARMSRSSVYETIEEEMSVTDTPTVARTLDQEMSIVEPIRDEVRIVEANDTRSVRSWDEDQSLMILRRYHALKDEAHDTVEDSKRVWPDTPFSLYAIQCKFPVGPSSESH